MPGQPAVGISVPSSVGPGCVVSPVTCAKASNVVEFEGYVKRTTLRYKSHYVRGVERVVPEVLVYANTHPGKPLRLDEPYLRDQTHQAKIPHVGEHVAVEAVELDHIFVLKHSAISIENGEEYRRRLWVPAAVIVKSELRDRLADMLLTVGVKSGKQNGWRVSTQDIYYDALPLVPGDPRTKMKKLGPVARWLYNHHMIKPLVYDRGTLPSRHFAKRQVWELEEKYRSVPLDEVLAARREFSRREAEEAKKGEKSGGQLTLDSAEETDPMNLTSVTTIEGVA